MNQESRGLCVLLADISGSSKLSEKLGVAEAQHAVERCIRRMERAVEAFKGRVVKTQGDELTAVFDSTEAAMHAASEMQQRIDALPPVSGVALAIRAGLHCGAEMEQDGALSRDAADVLSRLVALAKAGQTLTTELAVSALPKAQRDQARAVEGLTLTMGDQDQQIGVCEVPWNHLDDMVTTRSSSSKLAPVQARLRLRLGDQELILGPDRPRATLGRDSTADIVTMDTRASRAHGLIEFRRDKYVLIDQSTNGTYVTFAGEPELVLKREEAILSGKGNLCFGHGAGDAPTETLEFEILG